MTNKEFWINYAYQLVQNKEAVIESSNDTLTICLHGVNNILINFVFLEDNLIDILFSEENSIVNISYRIFYQFTDPLISKTHCSLITKFLEIPLLKEWRQVDYLFEDRLYKSEIFVGEGTRTFYQYKPKYISFFFKLKIWFYESYTLGTLIQPLKTQVEKNIKPA
ncbi:hypothetical protein [Thermoflexibacter ruber]|nr:hypothetical protein [Thermoflexibacter ruber]